MPKKFKSRCKSCIHRKVCAYKDYYTDKEESGIDKCKHYKKEVKTTKPKVVIPDSPVQNIVVSCLPDYPMCPMCGREGSYEEVCDKCWSVLSDLLEELREAYLYEPINNRSLTEMKQKAEQVMFNETGYHHTVQIEVKNSDLYIIPVWSDSVQPKW